MFFEDRRIAPAARAVKLDDDRIGIFYPDLVDAVLIAVEREDAAVAAVAGRLQGVQNHLRERARRRASQTA